MPGTLLGGDLESKSPSLQVSYRQCFSRCLERQGNTITQQKGKATQLARNIMPQVGFELTNVHDIGLVITAHR